MAQVSDSTSGIQQAIRASQSQSPRRNQQVDSKESAENGRSNRLDQQKESNEAQQTRQTEDKVLISRETQEPTRESRVENGSRNVDNLRPPTEQREDERGAAQKLNDQNEVDSPRGQNSEGRTNRIEAENSASNTGQEANAERSRTESREEAQTRDQIREEAADRKSSETRTREFQNKDEIRLEPQSASNSNEATGSNQGSADAARPNGVEAPSQRIIQEESPSGGTEQVRSADNNARADQAESNRQSPNPTSVQTQTGQNIDDLI